jgi:katanin p80 WD40 repeat-containing subunit B1
VELSSPSNTKIITAALSHDCNVFTGADENKSIFIWKKGRDLPIITLNGNSSLVTALYIDGNRGELYSGLKGGLVVIWDLESGKVKSSLQGHSSPITTLELAKVKEEPSILVTSALDGKIKVWDLRNKSSSINLKGHLETVKTLSICPDNSILASGADDGFVRLWDMRTTKLMKEFSMEGQNTVNCVEFNPHSITLAYSSNDKTVKHWDLERYSLISETPIDKLPIVKLKFDSTGKNAFLATNESLKYYMIDDSEPILLDLAEAGWNKLHDMKYIENEAIYGLSTYATKINLYVYPYEMIASQNSNQSVKRANSEICKKHYTPQGKKQVIDPKSQRSQAYENDKYFNNKDLFTTESLFQSNKDNIFKNAMNPTPEIIVQKQVVINNINSNVNINNISNFIENSDLMEMEPLQNFLERQNSDKLINHMNHHNDVTNLSMNSTHILNAEPMGLDISKFNKGNNYSQMDETMHEISQTNDLLLLQEINQQHNVTRGAISKRHNQLKMVSKYWSENNILSSLNAINLMGDLTVKNDFFNYVFSREDFDKLPFTLDNALTMLPLLNSLIQSKYENFIKTGCKTTMQLLQIFSEKIALIRSAYKAENAKFYSNDNLGNSDIQEKMKKCEKIIEHFEIIFKSSHLNKLIKLKSSVELSSISNRLYTDLEFFLKPFK